MMSRWSKVALVGLTAILLATWTIPVLAGTYADGTPETEYKALISANYLRGVTSVVSATSTTASVYTTGTGYTDGVHALCVYNAGSGTAYFSIDGTSPSASSCAFALPSGVGFTSITQGLVTELKVYTATTATVYVTK